MAEKFSPAEWGKKIETVDLTKLSTLLFFLKQPLFKLAVGGALPEQILGLLTLLHRQIFSRGNPDESWPQGVVKNILEGAFSVFAHDYYHRMVERIFFYATRDKPDHYRWKMGMFSLIGVAYLLERHPKEELSNILAQGSGKTKDVTACLNFWAERTARSEDFSALPASLNLTAVKEWADSQVENLRRAHELAGVGGLFQHANATVDGQTLVLDFSYGAPGNERDRWITFEINFDNSPSSCSVSWSSNNGRPSEALSVERLLAQLPESDYQAAS